MSAHSVPNTHRPNVRRTKVAIIGSGTAGLAAYRAARAHTDELLLIEDGPYGTTCARVGCMPSKLLIAAAESAHAVGQSERFGIKARLEKIDGRAVLERVRSERDRFAGFVVESVESFPAAHKLRGRAQFLDNNTLLVDGAQRIEAERIIIATGSRAVYPGFLGEAGDRLLLNDGIFELADLPRSVAVFGPGVIGLELGQALARLGVDVRMFGVGGALGPLRDPVIRDYAEASFNREFYLDPDARVSRVARTGTGVAITYGHRQRGEITESFDYLLAATGRKPNVDGLGLEHTDLQLDERGVPLFDAHTLRCGRSSIFIAGDAGNLRPLLHEAADEGRIAGDNAGRFPDIRSGLRRTPLAVVFSSPQIASVGLNLQQVQKRCDSCYAVGSVSFEDQGRSRVMGVNQGLLHVYGEQGSGLLLGAEMFGPAAEHIGHLLSWAVQKRMTVAEILDLPFYHPVIEEGVRTALRDLNAKLQLGPEVIERCLDCGPGA